jgi:uncharacterized membrane protein YhiD involved in acid resistance
MPDWLREAALLETPLTITTMAMRLVLAAVFGLVIAENYRLSHGRHVRGWQTLFGTLVLLTILLAMVVMVIGDSVARAFGLVGALSIVRFRTVVEDTRDTAFVIFAVVVGMAIGTGLVMVAALGVPVVATTAFALSARTRSPSLAALPPGESSTLIVRLGAGQPHTVVEGLLAQRARAYRLASVVTARQGTALDLTYLLHLADEAAAPAIVMELNALEGVQNVDLRRGGPHEGQL